MRSSAATHPETAEDLKGNGRIPVILFSTPNVTFAAADVVVTAEICDVVACTAVLC